MFAPTEPPVGLVPVVLPTADEGSLTVESACLALETIAAYGSLTGLGRTSPVRALVVDLMADLMHLCAQSGISFDAVVDEAGLVVASDCAGEVA